MKPAKTSIIIVLGPFIVISSLVIYSLKTFTELDWGSAVVLGFMVSYFGQIIIVLIFLSLMAGYVTLFYRRLCPHCGMKDLWAGQKCSDSIEADSFFMLSRCDRCHWQFREYPGEDLIPIPPDDERYWPDFKSNKMSG
jgi:rubredoxin